MLCGDIMEIPVLDHVILGDNLFYSYKENKVGRIKLWGEAKNFIFSYTLFAFGDIKNRKQDNNTLRCEEEYKMEKLMNKMDNMELDMVAGGRGRGGFEIRRPKDNSKSMAANVDETQMKLPIGKLPIGGGHKINV